MSPVTPELLQALLSPNGHIRSQAEAVYQTIPVVDRITGLVPLVAVNAAAASSSSLLAAVLLRREIVKLTSSPHLQELIPPLLHAFVVGTHPTAASAPATVNAIGHCLAEVCSSLSLLQQQQKQQQQQQQQGGGGGAGSGDKDVPSNVLRTILTHIQGLCRSGHVPSLRLLASLADKAPIPFTRLLLVVHDTASPSSGLASLYQPGWSSAAMAAWTQVLVKAALASTVTEEEASSWTSMNMAHHPTTLDALKVDASSPAATFVAPCLLPVLEWLLSYGSSSSLSSSSSTFLSDPEEQALLSMFQDLQQACVTVPSLLASHATLLNLLIQSCLQWATTSTTFTIRPDTSVVVVALSALQVVASLVSVGDVKRRCLTSDMVHRVTSTAIPLCVQLLLQTAAQQDEENNDNDNDWDQGPPPQMWLLGGGRRDEPDDNDDNDKEEFLFAMSLLEAFVIHLGAVDHVLPLVEPLLLQPTSMSSSGNINSNSNSSNTSKVVVGLSILEMTLSAAPMALIPHVPVLLQASLTLADNNNHNSQIQYHAIRVLGSLCETHAGPMVALSEFESTVFPMILERLAHAVVPGTGGDRNPNRAAGACPPKLSAMALWAMVSVAQNPILAQYMPPHLAQLLSILIQGPLSTVASSRTDPKADSSSLGWDVALKVRALGAMAAMAQACGGECFQPFYSQIIPGLLSMVVTMGEDSRSSSSSTTTTTTTTAMETLMGSSLDAAALIGQVVGKEVFATEAHQLLQWMMPRLQQQQQQDNGGGGYSSSCSSEMTETMLVACARIASVLEDDFAPYVHAVVPLLLQRIQQEPDVSIVEGTEGADQDSGEAGTESMTVAVPGRGFTKVSINTSKIQEQAQAIRALYEHAKAMGAAFPYIQESFDVLLPLVHFPYSSDVRSTCVQTLGAVMDAACWAGDEQSDLGLVRTYLPLVAQAIAQQIPLEDGSTDMEAVYALADSLSEVYHVVHRTQKLHPQVLNDFGLADAEDSVQNCLSTLTACLERRSQINLILTSGALTGEDEKQDYVKQLQEEQQLLTPLVDSIGYTLKFFGPSFVPIFEKYVIPVLGPKMEDQSDVRATLSAVCLFDDVVEHCGPDAAATYAPRLMQAVATALDQHSDEKELVQACVYGIAQMARHAPSGVLAGHLQAIVHRLLVLTSTSKEDAGDDVYLVEMAASALAAVTLLGPFQDIKFVPRERLVDSFLSQLPILQDDDEAHICHAGFCHLIETGVILLSLESGRVAKIIGDILVQVHEGEDVASPDTMERLSSILYQMQQSLAPSTLQQAFGTMDPNAQQIATSILYDMSLSRARIVTP